MRRLDLQTVARLLEADLPVAGEHIQVCGVSIDSRTLRQGDLFFAVPGGRYDGHDFLASAQRQGAVGAVVQKKDYPDLEIPVLRVPDTVRALGKLASWYRRQLDAKVIAITGSAGKTSTRQILHHVLSRGFRCRQAPKSFNNMIGVPLTILSAEPEDQILLAELGSNHPGEIEVLSDMAQPDLAVITHIAPAHLEGFGSIQAIIEEKASILQGLRSGGKLFINGDIPELAAYIRRKYSVPFTMVGQGAYCDVRAEQMHSSGTGGWLKIEGRTVSVPLAGTAALRNVLTVWSICRELKIALSDFIEAVRTVQPAPMRLEVEHIGPLTVINDCYNANPASMENALDCLCRMADQQKRRSVWIAGDMLELGIHSESLHRQIGTLAVRCGIQVILAAGQYAEQFLHGAARPDNATAKIPQMRNFGTIESLCNNVHQYIRPDDIILVKASRSARLERVVDRLRDLFGRPPANV